MELNELFYQNYWWFLISLLGALLVFLLFVQGGQTMLAGMAKTPLEKTMLVNSLGRKWEFTFTTLVVFGGAFFASFPLFYSTSFGGAYWLWMAILFSFIIQAVSYEYRSKKGNFLGTKTYDTFLFINGLVGSFLLGVAVGTFFTGSDFNVNKTNILDPAMPVISTWENPWHGLEAIANWRNILLGVTILFLARVQGALYFMNNIDDESIYAKARKEVLYNGIIFVVCFLAFVGVTLTATGYELNPANGEIFLRKYKYFFNLIEMPWVAVLFVTGVVLVLYALIRSVLAHKFTKGIWFSGTGTVLVVLSVFFLAGYNNTPYYPSASDIQSSLTIYNSSSTFFTLQTMSVVSLLVPFVLAYIFYVWRAMDAKSITPAEMEGSDHKY
ncbi:cytochrome d ubiquinol oxidase subunit II [Barnesiella propionica]|uniref:cytochrome d ubiquinol oxidase subunit II n=1 Tax=Barnesiella propionica TaxID=2981781 RepID=UPI0011CB7101|nr:cytochrome d ubiquinol oxidase subunit II [Barnesiella propionica]MCU6769164.1 cytochrome d ubiquinol oxidase subunit II [Barnesiella propionica]